MGPSWDPTRGGEGGGAGRTHLHMLMIVCVCAYVYRNTTLYIHTCIITFVYTFMHTPARASKPTRVYVPVCMRVCGLSRAMGGLPRSLVVYVGPYVALYGHMRPYVALASCMWG